MNWEASDLEAAWKRFDMHVNFVFDGPLKAKTKEEVCIFDDLGWGERKDNLRDQGAVSLTYLSILREGFMPFFSAILSYGKSISP